MSATGSDRAELIAVLRRAEPNLVHASKRLRSGYQKYQASLGQRTAPVAADLRTLERDLTHLIRSVDATSVQSPGGAKAKTLVLRTLALMKASLADLRAGLRGSEHHRVAAMHQAQAHLRHGRRLQRQAGRALNFRWHL